MLDINFIREYGQSVRKAIREKKVNLDLDELLAADSKRRELISKRDELNHDRREHARKMKGDRPSPQLVREGKRIKEKLAAIESELKTVESQCGNLMLLVPNVYPDDTPVGVDETSNREIKRWGRVPKFGFPPLDHITLGQKLGIVDVERGVKVSGFRGYYLKDEGARLQWALLTYCIEKMAGRGFTFFIVPTMVRDMALVGSGHFPETRQEIYPVDDNYLVGTSEPSLLAYHAGETLDGTSLPLKYCAVSPCYRREVGSYGKDTKGLYRLHEFWKVEEVVICKNDLSESLKLFEEMLAASCEILQDLELPYRVVRMCTGDMGTGKYKMYDIETWMPSRNAFGETNSCSHLTDWQARRLNLRYCDDAGKAVYAHTMNNTVIASPRILIAILENFQQKDGSIVIPKVLQKLVGTKLIKP